jgi:hypothetical protein
VVLVTLPYHGVVVTAHLIVFAVVGVCMAALYNRLQTSLEPHRAAWRSWWLWLFVLLQVELLYAFGLLKFVAG